MGVDLSIDHVVGVVLDEDAFKEWQEAIDGDDQYYGEEFLYEAFSEEERAGIDFGTAGSYYTNEDENRHYLYIRRVSEHHDSYDIPGGIMGLGDDEKPYAASQELTLDEALRIYNIAQTMGTKEPKIQRFTAVLWH